MLRHVSLLGPRSYHTPYDVLVGGDSTSSLVCLHLRNQNLPSPQPYGRSGSAILPASGGDIKYQLIMLLFEVAYCARGEYLEDFMSPCETRVMADAGHKLRIGL